jgi:hypothetical protein
MNRFFAEMNAAHTHKGESFCLSIYNAKFCERSFVVEYFVPAAMDETNTTATRKRATATATTTKKRQRLIRHDLLHRQPSCATFEERNRKKNVYIYFGEKQLPLGNG